MALSGCGALDQCSSNKIKLDPAVLEQKATKKNAWNQIYYSESIDTFNNSGFEINYINEEGEQTDINFTFTPRLYNISFDYNIEDINGVPTITEIRYEYLAYVLLTSNDNESDFPILYSNAIPTGVTFTLNQPISQATPVADHFRFSQLYNADYTWQGQYTDFSLSPCDEGSSDDYTRDLTFTLSFQFSLSTYNGSNEVERHPVTQDVLVVYPNIANEMPILLPNAGHEPQATIPLDSTMVNPWVLPKQYFSTSPQPDTDYDIYFQSMPLLSESQQYQQGYNAGRNDGYNQGINHQLVFPDFLNGVFNSMNNILQVEIFPNVRLWYIFGIPLILGVIGFIIGFFRGGQ